MEDIEDPALVFLKSALLSVLVYPAVPFVCCIEGFQFIRLITPEENVKYRLLNFVKSNFRLKKQIIDRSSIPNYANPSKLLLRQSGQPLIRRGADAQLVEDEGHLPTDQFHRNRIEVAKSIENAEKLKQHDSVDGPKMS